MPPLARRKRATSTGRLLHVVSQTYRVRADACSTKVSCNACPIAACTSLKSNALPKNLNKKQFYKIKNLCCSSVYKVTGALSLNKKQFYKIKNLCCSSVYKVTGALSLLIRMEDGSSETEAPPPPPRKWRINLDQIIKNEMSD